MKIKNDKLVFDSKIKLLNCEQFNKKIGVLSTNVERVDYPWTIETMKTGNLLYTDKIMDCIAFLLTDGLNSALAHLGIRNKEQGKRDGVKEFDINNIEENLLKQYDLNRKGIHSIILGGMQLSEASCIYNDALANIKGLFQKYKIPFSTIALRKDVHFFGKYSLLFNQKEDTLFITTSLFDSLGIDGKKQKEMVLEEDLVTYNVYQKYFDKYGVNYKKERKTTTVKEYFESQFKDVKLNSFDKFI